VAARLPAALAYLLCVWFCWRIARRLAPGSEAGAAVIYATMLFTVGAAQLITTDYVLATCLGLAMWAFVEARFPPPENVGAANGSASMASAHQPRRWIAVMWVGFALAFVAKGPAALLPLPAILLFDWLLPGCRHRACRCPASRCSVAGDALVRGRDLGNPS
jgi:4-amino-4-deoxy-L-arabinose transferase-like glycosyltransferase